jgi:hypothetical protein
MKKGIVVLGLVMCWNISFGQVPNWEWARSAQSGSAYPAGGEGISVATDASGNAYISGWFIDTLTFGSYVFNYPKGVYVTKYDSLGNLEWAKCGASGLSSQAIGSCISADALGNSYFTGWYVGTLVFDTDTLTSVGSTDIFIVKYDSSGNLIWAKSQGGTSAEQSLGIRIDGNDNLYVIGNFSSPSIVFGTDTLFNTASSNLFLAKFYSSGNSVWAKSALMSPTGFVQSYGVTSDAFGNVYATGTFGGVSGSMILGSDTLISLGSYNIFLAKYNSSGNVIWAKCAGDSGYDKSFNVATGGNNSIFITGEFSSSSIHFGADTLVNSGGTDAFLVKYDSSGIVQWAKSIKGLNNDYGYCVTTNNVDKVYLSGGCYTTSSLTVIFDTLTLQYPVGSYDPSFIASYNFSGNLLFAKVLASGADDQNGLAVCPSGSVYMVGDFYQTNPFILGNDSLILVGAENVFLAKLGYSSIVDNLEFYYLQQSITLFPNPTSSTFTITSTNKIKEIKVYDVLGSEILSFDKLRMTGSETIDISGIAKGIYFAEIKTEKETVRKKLIKQ